jgi:hypothetical protein
METVARAVFMSIVPVLVATVSAEVRAEDLSSSVSFGLSVGFRSNNGGFQESCFGRGAGQTGTFLFGILVSGTPSMSAACDGGNSNAAGDGGAWAESNRIGSRASLFAGPRAGYSAVDARIFAGSTIQGQVRFSKTVGGTDPGVVPLLGAVKLTGSTTASGPSSGSLPYSVGQISSTLSVTYTLDSYTETDYITETYDSLQGLSNSRDVESPLFEFGVTKSITVRTGVWVPFRITVTSAVEAGGIAQAAPSYFYGTADFFSTAALPVGQPVFWLPDGYTAESPGLGIFDNQISAVPELPTAWSAMLGLCLLTGLRRQRLACRRQGTTC